MRILFLVSSLNAGGAERVASTLANAWSIKGYEVILVPCYSQGSGQSFYPLNAHIKVDWLSQRLSKNPLLARVTKPFILRKVIKEYQPDVVVSFLTNVNVMALLAHKGLSCPIIVCERSDPSFQQISSSLKRLRQLTYPWADVVMLQTEQSAKRFQQELPRLKKISVIPNPLPSALKKLSPTVKNQKVVVAMGRLVASKQFDVLIKNFATIAKQFPDWDLHIYGDGPEKDKLDDLIQWHDMGDQIILMGKTTTPWDVMRSASMLAMSSRLEGFPNVMLEAMANGLPVVCYDCPSGPRELSLDGKIAKLIPLGDEIAYQQALKELMQNADERNRLAMIAQESVFERYSEVCVLEQWDQLFKEVMA